MDVSRPHRAVSPSLDGDVLVALAGTTRPLTGREVSRLTGRASHSGVLDVLRRLTDHGLVDRTEAGRALLYALNRQHLAAPAVEALAGMRAELFRRITETVETWRQPPIHVSVFGSTARGDGDEASDIDVLVVRPGTVGGEDARWREQLDRLASAIGLWTGNRAAIIDVSETALRTARERTPALDAAARDGVALAGRDLVRLLG